MFKLSHIVTLRVCIIQGDAINRLAPLLDLWVRALIPADDSVSTRGFKHILESLTSQILPNKHCC